MTTPNYDDITPEWVERLEKAEAALAAIRTDLDTHHRDPNYCDLAWLVARVRMHVEDKP